MVSVFDEKRVSIIGGGTNGSITGLEIARMLPALLRELSPADLELLFCFLDVCHSAIVLKDDSHTTEASVFYFGRGVIKFDPRLLINLRNDHGNAADDKLRSMVRSVLKEIIQDATKNAKELADSLKDREQAIAKATAERERERELSQLTDPFYLIEQLTARVERLEARR